MIVVCVHVSALSKTSKTSLVPYVILTFIFTIVALILRYYGEPLLSHLYLSTPDCTTSKCLGFDAIYRLSCTLVLFFLIHAALLCCSTCKNIDGGSWIIKSLLCCVLLVISWLLPAGFYMVYVHVARLIAGVYLFFQILILIDCSYNWNTKWLENNWKIQILLVSLLCYIGCLTLLIFFYIWFTQESDCDLQKFFISFTLIGTLLFTILSITEKFASKGGILASGIVSLYCYWLCFSSLSSDPSVCNTQHRDSDVQLILGLIIGAISISYTGWSVATNNTLFGEEIDEIPLSPRSGDVERAEAKELDTEGIDVVIPPNVVKRNIKFHLLMMCASFYLGNSTQ
jgi:hypothetical protein